MKQLMIFIAAFALMTSVSQAQENETDFRDVFHFGLKAGLNYSNVYDTEGEDFDADARVGFAGGVFVAIPIGTYLGIQPEILYSQRGFQASGSILGSRYEFSRTLDYLDIPVFFSLKPSEFFTINAGPQFSYLLKSTDVFGNGVTSIEQESEFAQDNIRKNTLCFVMGVDINMKHIVLGVRAGWDMLNNIGEGNSTTPRYKNVWYQGTLGYRFYR